MKRLKLVLALSAVVAASGLFAAELVVPAQYPTIQKAVDAAKGGDVVLVKGGTYAGFRVGRRFEGEPVTIKSAPGERVTLSGMQKIASRLDGFLPLPHHPHLAAICRSSSDSATRTNSLCSSSTTSAG